MKDNNKLQARHRSNAVANQVAQKKQNGISMPSASTAQFKSEGIVQKEAPEEELQMKADVVQKAAPEEELQMKSEVLQKAGPEEELQMKSDVMQQAGEEEELQMKTDVVQKAGPEEELQMKKEVIQKAGPEEELPAQAKFETVQKEEAPAKSNNTGMPDGVKSGIENMSGMDMSDVKVNYNSSKPKEMGAHAYAQGNDIQIAPGQEQHLGHEAWHVVQQRQGRVKATKQMKSGVPVNDDPGLENEADVMGARAMNNR
jgi:hypothetical protein